MSRLPSYPIMADMSAHELGDASVANKETR
jgi:hypothetical protein